MDRARLIDLAQQAMTFRAPDPLPAFPYAYEPYYAFLYLLMATGEFDNAVELGTFYGVGALHLAAGNRTATVYTVDRDPSDWRIPDEIAGNIRRVIGDTVAMAAELPAEIPLLFIDAEHTTEAIDRELAIYLPRIPKGGVVVFDDLTYTPEMYDLRKRFLAMGGVDLPSLHWSGFGAWVNDQP